MLKRWFFTGLAVLVPIVITIYVLLLLFRFADGILGNYINKWVFIYFGYRIPGLGIVISAVIVLLVGAVTTYLRLRLFKRIDNFILRLPLVGKIYGPAKEIVNFIFRQDKSKFKKVVLLEYPRKGIYSIGFVTNETSRQINRDKSKKMLNVFVPSSPSPVTGYTLIVSEDEVIFLDISVEDASRLIVSGGMLNPEDHIEDSTGIK